MCFLYKLHPLFHLKILKIPFSNLQLFPRADDPPLLQEILSELAELRSGTCVREHVELHPSVKGVAIAAYHVVEVLTNAEGLGHAWRR